MVGWDELIKQEQEAIERILGIKDGEELRDLAWNDFKKTAMVVDHNPESPFIVWPAINRQPYQVWLPVVLLQAVKLEIKPWLNELNEAVVMGVPSSGQWYGEVLKRVEVLERDGWQVSYARLEKEKNLVSEIGDGVWRVGVPSYVYQRKQDGSRGKEKMILFNYEVVRGKVVVVLDDAIAEGLTLSYLGEGLKKELGARKVVVAGAMAKTMQGGKKKLAENKFIDKVISLVDVTKEVLNDLDR